MLSGIAVIPGATIAPLQRGVLAVPNRDQLENLRANIISDPEKADFSPLRPVIARSWKRSVLSSVRPDRSIDNVICEPILDQNFSRIADPVLNRLKSLIDDVGGFICLSDSMGTLTKFIGPKEVLDWAERIFPLEGSSMSEEIIGTNSEGTAIEEGVAVQVWGPEHFNSNLSDIYCTSVPVRDPIRRNIRGVVSLTLPSDIAVHVDSRSVLMTVQAAAAEITQAILMNSALPEQALLNEYLRETRKRGTEAVVAIGNDVTIASREAKMLLNEADYALLSAYSKEAEHFCQPIEQTFQCYSGRRLHLQVRPVFVGDSVSGSTIRIKEVEDRHSRKVLPIKIASNAFTNIKGKSLNLRLAIQQVTTAANHNLSVHLMGERGTGRSSLASAFAASRKTKPVFFDIIGDDAKDLIIVKAALKSDISENTPILRNIDKASCNVVKYLKNNFRDSPFVIISNEITDSMMPLIASMKALEVTLQPLSQRREDVPELIEHFLQEVRAGASAKVKFVEFLTSAELDENIAQLKEIVQTAANNTGSLRIDVKDISEFHKKLLSRNKLSRLQQAELKLLREALKEAGGNRLKAASILRIGRTTLYRKIDSYTMRGFDI